MYVHEEARFEHRVRPYVLRMLGTEHCEAVASSSSSVALLRGIATRDGGPLSPLEFSPMLALGVSYTSSHHAPAPGLNLERVQVVSGGWSRSVSVWEDKGDRFNGDHRSYTGHKCACCPLSFSHC